MSLYLNKKIVVASIISFSFFQLTYAAALLDIQFHHQRHSLSCEIASLKMALVYKGVSIKESDLLTLLPFSDYGSRKFGNIWGDPEVGFVGNIDGLMPNTGYGVYEIPIQNLASIFRPSEIINDFSLDELLTELDNGNPILVWGNVATGQDISWYTREGKYIKAIYGEHVRVMMGYTGTHEYPTSIILMDPFQGELHWTVQRFLNNWRKMQNRAVVIR